MLTFGVAHASAVSVSKSSRVFALKGAKSDNSGAGGYYPWEDKDAVRGLKFHAKKDFILKSVKLYNEKDNAGERVFSLLDHKGRVIAEKKVFVPGGESRAVLDFRVPKGRGYRLVADIHRGLYRNTEVNGYPYKVGDLAKIVSSDRGSKRYYYFFYDWEVTPVSAEVPVTGEVKQPPRQPLPAAKDPKAYTPSVDLSKTDVYGNGKVVVVSNAAELENAVANLSSNSTVILKEGVYHDVHVAFPKGVHHVTIKGEHKRGAKIYPLGKDDEAAFMLYSDNSEKNINHHINFVDFEVIGSTDSDRQFLRNPASGRYGPAFVYMKNLRLNNLWMGIFSGVNAHDWTVDGCSFANSQMSHAWYMLGWHLAVINSKFKNGSHDDLAIRGYYPSGELYDYYDDGDTDCKVNLFVEKRTGRRGFLPKDDWTHLIRHNQFLSWNMQNPQRSNYNTHIAVAYGIYDGDSGCNAERVYLPPQNIEISDNIFDNRKEAQNAFIDAITIDAREGINNQNPASINGIVLNNNRFFPQKQEEKFIASEDETLDIASIQKRRNEILHEGKESPKTEPKKENPQKGTPKEGAKAQSGFGFKGFNSVNIRKSTGLSLSSINKVLKEVAHKGGGVVTIPAGTVKADEPIMMQSGVVLQGTLSKDGKNLTTIIANFFHGAGLGLIVVRQKRDFVIQNLNLDLHNNDLNGIAINEGGSRNFLISHNLIENVGVVKYEVAAAKGEADGYGPKDGISLHDWDAHDEKGENYIYPENFTIQNNTIRNFSEQAIDLRYVRNYLIKDNYLENGTMGIDISTGVYNGEVVGNDISNMVTGAKIIGSRGAYDQNLKFHHNNIHNNPVVTYHDSVTDETYTGGDGLALQFPQKGVELYNNHIEGDKVGLTFWSGASRDQITMHDND